MVEAVAAERTKAYAERMMLDAQLADLQRKLQRRTANELGDGAEVDLHAALEAAFPDDRVSRVPKGVRGPDIIIEVFHHEVLVGSIVIDSKNYARSRWSSRFVEKLKADAAAEAADWAVLSTTAFPKDADGQLAVRDGVIIAHPLRVVALTQLLRRQIIQSHALRLNGDQRNSAANRLLNFIVSTEASDLFDALHKAADAMIDLEAKETDAQLNVHRRRGELIRDVQRFHENITTAISGLVSEPVSEEVAA